MSEALEVLEEPEERPGARNGEPFDRDLGVQLVTACALELYERNRNGSQRVLVRRSDPALAEDAVQDAFVELFKAASDRPEEWLATPGEADAERFFTDWTALANQLLNRGERDAHQDRVAGLKRLRIGADLSSRGGLAPPPGLDWIEEIGLDWGEIVDRFPPLLEHDSPLLPTILVRWCTGWDVYQIAGLLGRDTAPSEVFVRLVHLLRQHPRGWMSLAGYCSEHSATEQLTAKGRREDNLAATVDRNGWRDPFHRDIRTEGIALLTDWMSRTGKLPQPRIRPEYEWSAQARRELVARRVSFGFATNMRTFDRKKIWAPAESFTSIARRLSLPREVNTDTVRTYFKRLRQAAENRWISDLLPAGS
jgi:hypothetical protein